MKAKLYVGAKKYAVYIVKKTLDKTLEFLTMPARFISKKVQELKQYEIYGQSIQSNLPENYIQLEYLEGTGEQYVVTDFFFNNIATDTLTCDFMRTGTGKGSLLYGCRDAYKVNGYGFQFNDAGRTYRQYGDSDTGLGSTAVKNLNTRYTVKQTGYSYNIDGNSSAIVASNPVQNYPLTVFATRNADNPTTAITPMRLYNLNVMAASGNIILNLIPARRNDGILGLYDTVSENFYTNAGTGTFISGTEHTIAPTPLNPIEIKSVGDKTVNLFNKETITKGAYLNASGQKTANTGFGYSDFIKVTPGNTYTICGRNDGATSYRRVHAYNSSKTWLEQLVAEYIGASSDYKITFTTPDNCEYIRFSGMRSSDDYAETNIVQIEEGLIATAYEPYGYKIPVDVVNKNMLNTNAEVYNGYIGLMTVGEVIRYGSSTASKTYKKFAYFKPGVYTYSYNGSTSTGSLRFVLCDENEIVKEIVSTPVVQGRNEVTVTFTKEGWGYVSVLVLATDVQIEEGNTATPYEPYFNQTTNIYIDEPLRKLGNLTDYIDFENQKVVRNVKEIILNGSETWSYYNVSGVGKLFRTVVDTTLTDGNKSDLGVISNKYKTVIQSARTNNTLTGINRNVDLINDNFSNVTSWKNELARDNVNVYYPLATPTEQPITLPEISLPQGTITIDADTEIRPSKIIITGAIDNE